MSELTAESGTLPVVEGIQIGGEMMIIIDNYPVFLPVVTMEELLEDTLNWFEDGRLIIGYRGNPEHLAAWKRWDEEMKKEGVDD